MDNFIYDIFTVVQYYTDLAESLGIKAISDPSELDGLITKTQKRQVNLLKQENALHPHTYLQPFESDDVWNHVSICHTLTEQSFTRQNLLDQLHTAIVSEISKVGSPILLTGGRKVGKTWLCAQIPSLIKEQAVSLVRFCALTRLTNTLPKVLRGISKQLHIICQSSILPRSIENSGVEDMFELFKDILKEASTLADKPVVLVFDAFDKLAADAGDLSRFLSLCAEAIPTNVALVVSARNNVEEEEFYDMSKDPCINVVLKAAGIVIGNYSIYRRLQYAQISHSMFEKSVPA